MKISRSQASEELGIILQEKGIRAALIYLNSLTSHRFSALYRFDQETLNNLYFYDREHPEVDSCPDIPITASYCIFLYGTRQSFFVDHAMRDSRLVEHPKRKVIQAYCGVPLFNKQGQMFGSICHFNIDPLPISEDDLYMIETMAGLLQQYNEINQYDQSAAA